MERSMFHCMTQSQWPSRTTSIWPTSAITSPSLKPISCAPNRAPRQRRQHRRRSVHPGWFCRFHGRGGGSGRILRRQWRHRHLDPRRRYQRFVVRSLPHLQGFVDHTVHPGGQPVPDRCAGSEDQHHRGPVELLPVVPHRHQRLRSTISASVSPATPLTTPSIPSCIPIFRCKSTQPILAGFGLATNERFIRIAKRNAQITDLAFKAQVIATVTQVENIYWDLVNAYEASRSASALSASPTRISPTIRSSSNSRPSPRCR
jgi:hypothetical protein